MYQIPGTSDKSPQVFGGWRLLKYKDDSPIHSEKYVNVNIIILWNLVFLRNYKTFKTRCFKMKDENTPHRRFFQNFDKRHPFVCVTP